MLRDIRTAFDNSAETILQDIACAAALVVILLAGLLLPGLA